MTSVLATSYDGSSGVPVDPVISDTMPVETAPPVASADPPAVIVTLSNPARAIQAARVGAAAHAFSSASAAVAADLQAHSPAGSHQRMASAAAVQLAQAESAVSALPRVSVLM